MRVVRFGRFELGTDEGRLSSDGEPIPLQAQVSRLLVHLVTHRDRVVTQEELLETLWPGKRVVSGAVTTAIGSLRAALGDTTRPRSYVRTVRGVGYRFVATVTVSHTGRARRPQSGPAEARHRAFVGRVRPMRQLRPLLEGASAPRLAYLHGPVGIGKTSLLQELAYRRRASGRSVRCLDADHIEPTPAAFRASLADAAGSLILLDNLDARRELDRWVRAWLR